MIIQVKNKNEKVGIIMGDVRNWVWIFPLIGSILTAISIFTPAAALYIGGTLVEYNWIHGFYVNPDGAMGANTGFVDIPGVLIPGIISAGIIAVCTLIMFITALTHRREDTPGSWLVLGILLIIGALIFIIGAEIGLAIDREIEYGISGVSFWENRTPGFAVIAPFIASGLAILAFILGRSLGKGEVAIRPVSAAVPPPTPAATPVEAPGGFSFCPECGQKITAESQFCTNCGYELRKT